MLYRRNWVKLAVCTGCTCVLQQWGCVTLLGKRVLWFFFKAAAESRLLWVETCHTPSPSHSESDPLKVTLLNIGPSKENRVCLAWSQWRSCISALKLGVLFCSQFGHLGGEKSGVESDLPGKITARCVLQEQQS